MPPVFEQSFASFLVYSPQGKTDSARRSRQVVSALKENKIFDVMSATGEIVRLPIAEAVAQRIAEQVAVFPATDGLAEMLTVFAGDATLVPVPRSSLMKPGTLWPAQCLTKALVGVGFATRDEALLERVLPVRKAALAAAKDRPPSSEHYKSMRCAATGLEPRVFVLVDDVVTRGAQLLAAAGVLRDGWPNATVRAFAAVRTMSGAEEVTIVSPCVGSITWNNDNPRRVP